MGVQDNTRGPGPANGPVDIVFLSEDGEELGAVAAAQTRLGADAVSLQTINFRDPGDPASIARDFEYALTNAKLVIVRFAPHTNRAEFAILAHEALRRGVLLALFSGDGRDDEDLRRRSTVSDADYSALLQKFAVRDEEGIALALRHAASLVGQSGIRTVPESWLRAPPPTAMFMPERPEQEPVAQHGSGRWLTSFATVLVALFVAGAGAVYLLQSQMAFREVSYGNSPLIDWPSYGYYPADDFLSERDNSIELDVRSPLSTVTPITSATDSVIGRFAYGVPSVMITGDPYFLSVTVAAPRAGETTPELDVRLAQDTRETLGFDPSQLVRPGDVAIGQVMSVSLTGADFDIKVLSEARQDVDASGVPTRWLWEVSGKKAGRVSLLMQISIVGADGAPDRVVRRVASTIDVRSEADAFLSKEQISARDASGPPLTQSDSAAPAAAPQVETLLAQPPPAPAAPSGTCASTGRGDRRLALVIGNNAYTGIAPLTYARADSVIMRDVLVEAGFRVTHCEDLGADQISSALDTFRAEVKRASARGETSVAFYYSGHGASTPTHDETYLLPVSLRRATVGQIESQGLAVGQVIGGLSNAGARRLIVIVDACRDVLRMEDGEYRGLRVLNWRTSAYDIVAYATMWGEKARDNGLYAKALAASIRALPKADVADVLNRVQTEISNATREDQVPQYNDRMPGVFAFLN